MPSEETKTPIFLPDRVDGPLEIHESVKLRVEIVPADQVGSWLKVEIGKR